MKSHWRSYANSNANATETGMWRLTSAVHRLDLQTLVCHTTLPVMACLTYCHKMQVLSNLNYNQVDQYLDHVFHDYNLAFVLIYTKQ